MELLTSTYFALYQTMSLCVKDVEQCEKLWERSPSDLVCQILFFVVDSTGKKEVPRDSK